MTVFNIKIKKNNFSKSLKLRLDPTTNNFIVTAPIKCSKKTINSFIQSSKDWMNEMFKPREKISKLNILEEEFKVINSDKDFLDFKNKTIYTSNYKITKMLKDFSHDVFKKECLDFAKKIGVTFDNFVTKDLKRSLGHYVKGRSKITISTRLLFATKKASSYVCAHEVCHIVHQNHKKEFYALLESLIKDHKEQEVWLKKNIKTLLLIE